VSLSTTRAITLGTHRSQSIVQGVLSLQSTAMQCNLLRVELTTLVTVLAFADCAPNALGLLKVGKYICKSIRIDRSILLRQTYANLWRLDQSYVCLTIL
jgi:hypothetical protein